VIILFDYYICENQHHNIGTVLCMVK